MTPLPTDTPRETKAGVTVIDLYTVRGCGYCRQARALLDRRGIAYMEHSGPGTRDRIREISGRRTAPLIVIGGTPIGGAEDLARLDRAGRLAAHTRTTTPSGSTGGGVLARLWRRTRS